MKYQNRAIIAGAGSRKTQSIVDDVRARIENTPQNEPFPKIIIFSLTNSAVGELRQRIESVNVAQYVKITTVHAFCAQITEVDPAQYTIIDDLEHVEIVKRVRDQIGADAPLKETINYQSRDKQKMAIAAKHKKFDQILKLANAVDSAMAAARVETYDMMARRALNILRANPTVAGEFDIVYIDEAQDIDGCLWDLLEVIPKRAIVAVGDPRQAIFQFRGGDCARFLEFANEDSTETIYKNINYRSGPDIVGYANSIHKSDLFDPMESAAGILSHEVRTIDGSGAFDALWSAIDRVSLGFYKKTAILCQYNHTLDMLEETYDSSRAIIRMLPRYPAPTDGEKIVIAWARSRSNVYDEQSARMYLRHIYGAKGDALTDKAISEGHPPGFYIDSTICSRDNMPQETEALNLYDEIMRHCDNGGSVGSYLLQRSRSFEGERMRMFVPSAREECVYVLSTIHNAKGREFDDVVLLMPKSKPMEPNLHYVGATRARHRLTIILSDNLLQGIR